MSPLKSAFFVWSLLLLGYPGIALFSQTAARASSFAGNWQAQFKGKTFVVLKLREEGGKLAGTVIHTTHFETDADGNLTGVEETNTEDRVLEVRITSDRLVLKIADNGDEANPVQCELTLVSKDTGELQMIVPPPGQKLKPWKIDRTSPA